MEIAYYFVNRIYNLGQNVLDTLVEKHPQTPIQCCVIICGIFGPFKQHRFGGRGNKGIPGQGFCLRL